MHEPYRGLRPHVESAVSDGGADPNRVIRDSTLARLDHLLCAADEHARYGRIDAARATIEGARCHLAEVDAVARAARSAFDEACSRCEAAAARLEPSPDETMADPDRVPTEDQPPSDIPAEGEAGQKAMTEDHRFIEPTAEQLARLDAEDDPPPEDDPPLGRKGRRR